jgi:hypothetical protein
MKMEWANKYNEWLEENFAAVAVDTDAAINERLFAAKLKVASCTGGEYDALKKNIEGREKDMFEPLRAAGYLDRLHRGGDMGRPRPGFHGTRSICEE